MLTYARTLEIMLILLIEEGEGQISLHLKVEGRKKLQSLTYAPVNARSITHPIIHEVQVLWSARQSVLSNYRERNLSETLGEVPTLKKVLHANQGPQGPLRFSLG